MLEVRDLAVSYGAVRAIRSVDLNLSQGELVTVIGSNGAGKSTLLRTISGLVRPAAGTITLEKQSLVGRSADAIACMGIAHVPEGRKIFGSLTVEQNLLLGATARKDASELVADFERVYEMFPVLRDRRKQQGWALSGGQQQMLAIGRGLMSRPRVLMLDEPSLGLAPLLVRQVLATVRGICDGGTAVLLVEQNARAALKIADRGLVLRAGEVIREGAASSLYSDSSMRQTYLGA